MRKMYPQKVDRAFNHNKSKNLPKTEECFPTGGRQSEALSDKVQFSKVKHKSPVKMKKVKKEKSFTRRRTHLLVKQELSDRDMLFIPLARTKEERRFNRKTLFTDTLNSNPAFVKRWAIMVFSVFVFSLSSCATVFGGKATDHQKHKPMCGEPKREIRVGYLVADIILFSPGLIVDFITGKIYHPVADPQNTKQCEGGAK